VTADLTRQLAFLGEADKLKGVVRANVLMDGSRCENTAEHSWHLALWAMVMAPYAPPGTDIDRAIAMALMHDLVEIDAGDHPIHLKQDMAAIIAKDAPPPTGFSLFCRQHRAAPSATCGKSSKGRQARPPAFCGCST